MNRTRPDTITVDKRTEDQFSQQRTEAPQAHLTYVTALGEVREYHGEAAARRRAEIEREAVK